MSCPRLPGDPTASIGWKNSNQSDGDPVPVFGVDVEQVTVRVAQYGLELLLGGLGSPGNSPTRLQELLELLDDAGRQVQPRPVANHTGSPNAYSEKRDSKRARGSVVLRTRQRPACRRCWGRLGPPTSPELGIHFTIPHSGPMLATGAPGIVRPRAIVEVCINTNGSADVAFHGERPSAP